MLQEDVAIRVSEDWIHLLIPLIQIPIQYSLIEQNTDTVEKLQVLTLWFLYTYYFSLRFPIQRAL
jgi:uncharacterized membrane protein